MSRTKPLGFWHRLLSNYTFPNLTDIARLRKRSTPNEVRLCDICDLGVCKGCKGCICIRATRKYPGQGRLLGSRRSLVKIWALGNCTISMQRCARYATLHIWYYNISYHCDIIVLRVSWYGVRPQFQAVFINYIAIPLLRIARSRIAFEKVIGSEIIYLQLLSQRRERTINVAEHRQRIFSVGTWRELGLRVTLAISFPNYAKWTRGGL